jgi:hypothetical protein
VNIEGLGWGLQRLFASIQHFSLEKFGFFLRGNGGLLLIDARLARPYAGHHKANAQHSSARLEASASSKSYLQRRRVDGRDKPGDDAAWLSMTLGVAPGFARVSGRFTVNSLPPILFLAESN